MGTYLSSQQVESCPFCGGKTMKIVDTLVDPADERPFLWVECQKCGACGGPSKDLNKAIWLWNLRY